jgi:hypothetical protein
MMEDAIFIFGDGTDLSRGMEEAMVDFPRCQLLGSPWRTGRVMLILALPPCMLKMVALLMWPSPL